MKVLSEERQEIEFGEDEEDIQEMAKELGLNWRNRFWRGKNRRRSEDGMRILRRRG